jgi:glycosyltransferase involved in cell wall biosynthesis
MRYLITGGAASDVSLVTLKREVNTSVLPYKIFNIMASAKPVIGCTNLEEDASKLIKKANCGYCIEPENPEELAKVIKSLHNNPQKSKKLGDNGRKFAIKFLSKPVFVNNYEDIFSKLIKKIRLLIKIQYFVKYLCKSA